MILKKFEGKSVSEELKFDFNFFDDISFLIGINGSGKTTVLKLILGLLMPSFYILTDIYFDEISLECENNGKIIKIRAKNNNKEVIILSIDGIEEKLEIPTVKFMDYEEKLNMYIELERKLKEHPVLKQIYEIPTPMYLGLDRKIYAENSRESLYLRRKISARNDSRNIVSNLLEDSINEIQRLVIDYIRKLKSVQDGYSNDLKKDIILSAFNYTPSTFLFDGSKASLPTFQDRQKLEKRKKEIINVSENLGLDSSELLPHMEKFFTELEKITTSLVNNKDNSLSKKKKTEYQLPPKQLVEWLVNKPQIERIENLLKLIEDYQKKVDDLFKPVKDFVETINLFLIDGNKKVEIIGGELSINTKGRKITPYLLSSGEKQILIMFAHLVFNISLQETAVFIIDEPELSLHLKWQEDFVKSLRKVNPNLQLILSTHSPSIVFDMDDKCIDLSNSKD